ncbi:MAG TPA: ATP-binding protein [bacterium]|nr:ATP-binding protein [bacterium]HQG45943.1 ATP-binding protein [bacterium]HQI48062.1 ATP-binding protein [bacterium]HQJ63320.1 ATP-binding protein [bacterium]
MSDEDLDHHQQGLPVPDDYLLQAEKMSLISLLAPGLAHDAGTPLMAITSITQYLKEKSGDPMLAEKLTQIERSVDQLSQIFRILVEVTRPVLPGRQKLYLNSLILEAVRMIKHDRRLKYREVKTELMPEIPQVLASADQLLLVLLALCMNAADGLEAVPEGRVVIKSWQEADRVLVSVADSGAGIRREIQPRLFSLGVTTRSSGVGRGLGLHVCRAILTAHGGTIALSSEAGHGTTVTIALPALLSGSEE